MTIAASVFEADITAASGDLSESVTFLGKRGSPAFSVSNALVGDVPASETGRLDGDLEAFAVQIVVTKSACTRAPFIGERVVLASGRTVRIRAITDDPSGASYPIEAEPEARA